MAKTVWLVETIDYDSQVVGVYATVEDAVALLRATYQHPYKVEWFPLEPGHDGSFILKAKFAVVYRYSTEHEALWSLSPVEVQRVPPDRKGSQ